MNDLYEALGVERSATETEIHAAYLKLARTLHPDTNGGIDSEEFRRVKMAHDVLVDDHKRQVYDETGFVEGDQKTAGELSAVGAIKRHLNSLIGKPDENLVMNVRGAITRERNALVERRIAAEGALSQFEATANNINKRWRGTESIKRVALASAEQAVEQTRDHITSVNNQIKAADSRAGVAGRRRLRNAGRGAKD